MSSQKAANIVVLTGAGISAESGLKTFRGDGGLWEGQRVEEVCTPEAFASDPERVNRFYNARRQQLLQEAKPNPAHLALADFETRHRGGFTLITQNVDNLHEQAGSLHVMHMHGELLKARCLSTLTILPWQDDITPETHCPCCNQIGRLRPHIVWFGEIPFYMFDIDDALASCDYFIAVGTSGTVYPAAGFVEQAASHGAHTIEVNLEVTSHLFDEHIEGPASIELPKLLDRLVAPLAQASR